MEKSAKMQKLMEMMSEVVEPQDDGLIKEISVALFGTTEGY